MEALIGIYVLAAALSLLLLYAIIRGAVRHGTTDALRSHEMWMRDGSLEDAIDKHAAKAVDREEQARAARQQHDRERR